MNCAILVKKFLLIYSNTEVFCRKKLTIDFPDLKWNVFKDEVTEEPNISEVRSLMRTAPRGGSVQPTHSHSATYCSLALGETTEELHHLMDLVNDQVCALVDRVLD